MGSPFWAIVLLSIALALFFAEVFIPSGGMILATAVLCIILSVWSAGSAWWDSNQPLFWGFVAATVILIPVSLSSAITLWPRTAIGRRAEPPTLEEVTPYLEEQRRLEQLIGQIGETDTPLNPGGFVRIQGKRIHCRSEGLIVHKGAQVTILSVAGNSLVVREVLSDHLASANPQPPFPGGKNPDPRKESLDFELPDS